MNSHTITELYSLKRTAAVREIKMYHQSVTILPGLLRSCCLLHVSARVALAASEDPRYWIEWAILGDIVTKCPYWVLHAQWDSVCVCGIVGMCAIYYLRNSKRQKICEACHVSCPGQSLTKERGRKWGGEGRQDRWKRVQGWESVKEMVCLCFVPLGLNWAAGKGAITCVSLTAHSLITPTDS